MPSTILCPECGRRFRVRKNDDRDECPECGAWVDFERFSRPSSSSTGLVIGLVAGAFLLFVAAIGAIAFLAIDQQNGAPVPAPPVAVAPPPPPIVRPNPEGKFPLPPAPNFPRPDFPNPGFHPPEFPPPGLPLDPFAPIPLAFELPPLPESVKITPSPIKETTRYKLPEAVSGVKVGGGGRFLILRFPGVRKLGIFDATTAKIERYIPFAENDAEYAAGMSKLVVYLPGAKLIRRYDLLTGEQEHSGPFVLEGEVGKPDSFCLGHASSGPLLAGGKGRSPKLYDLTTFQELVLPIEVDAWRKQVEVFSDGPHWAGATGRVFGHAGGGRFLTGAGLNTIVYEQGKFRRYSQGWRTMYMVPGPDDRHVFPGGLGVVNTHVEAIPDVPRTFTSETASNLNIGAHIYLPASHGPYYFHPSMMKTKQYRLPSLANSNQVKDKLPEEVPVGTMRIFLLGHATPITSLPNVEFPLYEQWDKVRNVGVENTVHLIPKAKLLVVLTSSRTELILYPFDAEKALDESGLEYLIFTSDAPNTFRPGATFEYTPTAKAKAGPVKFKLDSGPPGMTIAANGMVRWEVPANFSEQRVDVILTAIAGSNKETFQTLTLTATGSKEK